MIISRCISCVPMSCVNNCCFSIWSRAKDAFPYAEHLQRQKAFKHRALSFPVTQASTLCFTPDSNIGLVMTFAEQK